MSNPFRIAIAGLGTVGSATLDVLERNQSLIAARAGRCLDVVAVSAQHKQKHAHKIKDGIQWFDEACAMATLPEIDAVVVLIGGADGMALKTTEAFLNAGKSVVTANKALLRHIHPLDIQFARELGYSIKLLGTARLSDDGLEKWVGPCLVPKHLALANTDDVLNAISIYGDAVGPLTLTGCGAGGEATASAVIADLVDLARGTPAPAFGIPTGSLRDMPPAPDNKRIRSWYVRLHVTDQAGVIAEISTILRDEDISIESMIQRGSLHSDYVPMVIKTHKTNEAAMRRALTRMTAIGSVKEPPVVLRIGE